MKINVILKSLMIFIVLLSGCNKDDGNTDCVKDNYFKAEFDGGVIEPHYAQGGGFGLYTLYLERCDSNENNWLLSITTENSMNFYLNLNITSTGIFQMEMGDINHLALDCDDVNSIYLTDHATSSLVFISTSTGTIEITEFDSRYGILVGIFTVEMVSTSDPSIKKTITGEFNLNKSTLDNRQKPCWL